MGKSKKYLFYIILIGLIICSCQNKKSLDQDLFLYEIAIESVKNNIQQQEYAMHDQSYKPGEITKSINNKLRVIFNIDNNNRVWYFKMVDDRNINTYNQEEVISKLDSFKENIAQLLNDKQKNTFNLFIKNIGYYDEIEHKYSSNKELKLMLAKKYLILKLATLEAIYIIYD